MMRQGGQARRGRLDDEGRTGSREVALVIEACLRVEREERGQDVVRPALFLELERRDRADARDVRARRADRVARDLDPGLGELMYESSRLERPDECEVRHAVREVRHETRRETQ